MIQLKELRWQAKEKGLKGYSTLRKEDLELLLSGKKPLKRLRKKQVSDGTQTDYLECAEFGKIDWLICSECGMNRVVAELKREAEIAERRRRIVEDNGVFIDSKTGEVLDCDTDLEWMYRR